MEEIKKETKPITPKMTFEKLLKTIKFDNDIFKCAVDENYWM